MSAPITWKIWFIAALLCVALPQHSFAKTIIHAGQLLDKPGENPNSEQTLVLEDGRITEIREGYVPITEFGQDASLIDLSSSFVLPGLIDSHVHILGEFGPKFKLDMVEMSNELQTLRGVEYARRTLNAGFTTIRDPGADPGPIFALRDAIQRGYVKGPRIIAAGMAITPTGGHGDVSGFREDVAHVLSRETVCDGPYDCRRAVRHAVRSGADVIKVTATGGVLSETNTGTGQQLEDDELKEIVQTAHSLGRKVAAHAHDADGINAALKAGVDSIEHGTYLDDESVTLFKQNNAYLVPTLMVGDSAIGMAKSGILPPFVAKKAMEVPPNMLKATAKAHKAGVKIAFGTDSGVSPHGNNAQEFLKLKEAGLSEMEAIKAATVNAADLLGLAHQVGTLEAGKAADIVAVSTNPLDDIAALQNIAFVMKGGEVIKHDMK